MKNKGIILGIILSFFIVFSPVSYAEETNGDVLSSEPSSEPSLEPSPEPSPEPVQDPREYPNVDTLPRPSEDLILEDPWTNSSLDPQPDNLEIDPPSQDEPETWAVVDENGNTVNIIVCDIDFCGSGWIPTAYDGFTPTEWARVVLQSSRNPETGQNKGGHWGQYNFPSGVWTESWGQSGTYQIPVEYDQDPFCIADCPISDPEEVIEGSPTESTNIVENEKDSFQNVARSSKVKVELDNRNLSFVYKAHKKKNIRSGKIWVIAKNNNDKKVWKFSVKNNGKSVITLPKNYLNWNIFVNYKLNKNNKKISKKIIINN